MKSKLKIGLLLDGYYIANWALQMVERIAKSNYAEINLLIIDDKHSSTPERPHYDQQGGLFRIYTRIDEVINRRFSGTVINALEKVELPSYLKRVQMIHVQSKKEGNHKWIPEEDVIRIEEFKLDALVDTGLQINHLATSACARYGVWSINLGDNSEYNDQPPGFWEIYDGNPVTGSNVQVLRDNSHAMTIYQSYSHTATISLIRNQNMSYYKCASFIPRKMEELYNRGDKAIEPVRQIASPQLYNRESRNIPCNKELLSFFLQRYPRDIDYVSKKLLFDHQWTIRFGFGDSPLTIFDDFQALVPPPNTWWADPQVVYYEGNYFIFIEELKLPRRTNHGHISVIKIDGEGKHNAPIKVLEKPYHLSYPSVLMVNNTFYMVPETSNNRSIELYEAVDFPWKWQFKKNLMTDVLAVDSALVFKDELWWLFTNIKENKGASINDETFLFFSDDFLSGNWEPHPLNPIISDARCARSAGGIFKWEDSLFRPSQDCSQRYGLAVNINKIIEMNKKKYKEVRNVYLKPNRDSKVGSIHTYNFCNKMTVIDAYVSQFRIKFR